MNAEGDEAAHAASKHKPVDSQSASVSQPSAQSASSFQEAQAFLTKYSQPASFNARSQQTHTGDGSAQSAEAPIVSPHQHHQMLGTHVGSAFRPLTSPGSTHHHTSDSSSQESGSAGLGKPYEHKANHTSQQSAGISSLLSAASQLQANISTSTTADVTLAISPLRTGMEHDRAPSPRHDQLLYQETGVASFPLPEHACEPRMRPPVPHLGTAAAAAESLGPQPSLTMAMSMRQSSNVAPGSSKHAADSSKIAADSSRITAEQRPAEGDQSEAGPEASQGSAEKSDGSEPLSKPGSTFLSNSPQGSAQRNDGSEPLAKLPRLGNTRLSKCPISSAFKRWAPAPSSSPSSSHTTHRHPNPTSPRDEAIAIALLASGMSASCPQADGDMSKVTISGSINNLPELLHAHHVSIADVSPSSSIGSSDIIIASSIQPTLSRPSVTSIQTHGSAPSPNADAEPGGVNEKTPDPAPLHAQPEAQQNSNVQSPRNCVPTGNIFPRISSSQAPHYRSDAMTELRMDDSVEAMRMKADDDLRVLHPIHRLLPDRSAMPRNVLEGVPNPHPNHRPLSNRPHPAAFDTTGSGANAQAGPLIPGSAPLYGNWCSASAAQDAISSMHHALASVPPQRGLQSSFVPPPPQSGRGLHQDAGLQHGTTLQPSLNEPSQPRRSLHNDATLRLGNAVQQDATLKPTLDEPPQPGRSSHHNATLQRCDTIQHDATPQPSLKLPPSLGCLSPASAESLVRHACGLSLPDLAILMQKQRLNAPGMSAPQDTYSRQNAAEPPQPSRPDISWVLPGHPLPDDRKPWRHASSTGPRAQESAQQQEHDPALNQHASHRPASADVSAPPSAQHDCRPPPAHTSAPSACRLSLSTDTQPWSNLQPTSALGPQARAEALTEQDAKGSHAFGSHERDVSRQHSSSPPQIRRRAAELLEPEDPCSRQVKSQRTSLAQITAAANRICEEGPPSKAQPKSDQPTYQVLLHDTPCSVWHLSLRHADSIIRPDLSGPI